MINQTGAAIQIDSPMGYGVVENMISGMNNFSGGTANGNGGVMVNMSQGEIQHDVPMIATQDGLTFNIDCLDKNSYPGTGTVWTSTVDATNIGTITGAELVGDHMHFDGGNDFVEFVTTSNSITSDPFTIEVWFKADASGHRCVFTDSSQSGGGFFVKEQATNVYLYGTASGSAHKSGFVAIGTWYQMVITIDGLTASFWKNGVELGVGGNDAAPAFIFATNDPFFIASDSGGAGDFEGDIDIVRMYDRVLTTAEIEHNFEAYRDRFGL